MLNKRAVSLLSIFAVAGLAACGGEAEVADDAVVTDTLVSQETEMVEVPVTVPDTALVTQDVDVDVDVDTVDVPPR